MSQRIEIARYKRMHSRYSLFGLEEVIAASLWHRHISSFQSQIRIDTKLSGNYRIQPRISIRPHIVCKHPPPDLTNMWFSPNGEDDSNNVDVGEGTFTCSSKALQSVPSNGARMTVGAAYQLTWPGKTGTQLKQLHYTFRKVCSGG